MKALGSRIPAQAVHRCLLPSVLRRQEARPRLVTTIIPMKARLR